jgi:hypothetical protein
VIGLIRPPGAGRASTLLAGIAIVLASSAPGIAQGVSQSAVKAAFLFNFAKFTEWPPGRLAPQGTLRFCVTEAAVAEALRTTVADRLIRSHPLVVALVKPDDDLRDCALAYVGPLEPRSAARLVESLRGAPVLSVSDFEQFTALGGIVHFYKDDGRMRFAINTAAAERAQLRLDSQLLSLAKVIKEGGAR